MAGKPRNRLELRRQYEAAEPLDPMEDDSEDIVETPDDDDEAPKAKKKPKAAPKKARAVKAPKPAARMRIVWQVVNDAFKVVATFEYTQKDAAEAKAAEMIAKGKGNHFVQKVKEAMAEDAPGLGAGIPRIAEGPTAPRPSRAKPKSKAAIREEEPEEEEEDLDEEEEEEEVDDDE
jgi:hypothetical protein